MAEYLFSCDDCSLLWSKDGKPSKAPKKAKCPSCEKNCGRYYGPENAPSLKLVGMDFQSYRSKVKKHQEKGWNKEDAHSWYNSQIKEATESVNTKTPYRKYEFDPEAAKAKGVKMKKLKKDELDRKIEESKRLTIQSNNLLKDRKNK